MGIDLFHDSVLKREIGIASSVDFPFVYIYWAVLRRKTLHNKSGFRRFGDAQFSYVTWDA